MVKVQKNRKKSWRKHTDIKEVEEFLEDERLAERVGLDTSLPTFIIETRGDANLQPASDAVVDSKVKRVGLKRTKDIVHKLACYKNLENHSKVKPAIQARAGPKTLQQRQYEKKMYKLRSSDNKGPIKTSDGLYDMWTEAPKVLDVEMAELELKQQTLIGKNPKKYPVNLLNKPSLLPSVEVPQPGASYNPSLEDHQALLGKAHKVELRKVKEIRHLNRVVTSYYTKATEEEKQDNWMDEMTQGLGDVDAATLHESSMGPRNPAVKAENRKSIAQKRRDEEQKEKILKTKQAKEKAQKDRQIFTIKGAIKELKEKAELSKERAKKRTENEVSKMYGARRMSRHKFEEQDIEVNLSSEIKGTLRGVKTDGHLLLDRFKSLQKRNIIETRKFVMKNRNKSKRGIKKVLKKDHREPL